MGRKRERERRLSLEKNESERHEFEQRIRVGIEEYIEGVQRTVLQLILKKWKKSS